MTDNYAPGTKNLTDAPFNYDPERNEVECANCLDLIKESDAKKCNDNYFCDEICLERFLNY